MSNVNRENQLCNEKEPEPEIICALRLGGDNLCSGVWGNHTKILKARAKMQFEEDDITINE